MRGSARLPDVGSVPCRVRLRSEALGERFLGSMIYLKFAISGEGTTESVQRGTADFMFQSEDARECTRRAVETLRDRGFRALGIEHAWEGFALQDFPSGEGLLDLFALAEEQGHSFEINLSEKRRTERSPAPIFSLSYAAGR